MTSSSNFCRMCLQKFTGLPKVLSQDMKTNSMVKHLFPGMDINLVKVSKICIECFKYIQFSYSVRKTVIKNEQKINSNMASIKTIEENTCRLCLNTNISEKIVFLYEDVNQVIPFLEARDIIEIAVISMRFEIFKKPVVCSNCWQIVRSIYLFKKRCFATEKVLKFYCTENNLTSLTNKEIESLSNCYNSNLQKFSKGEKNDFNFSFMLRENMDNASKAISNSIDNVIKPVDVYLNNFTTDDEDDIFEEEVDDIFVEDCKIVKKYISETLVTELKLEIEKQHDHFDRKSQNVDKIDDVVKNEQAGGLNTIPKGAEHLDEVNGVASRVKKEQLNPKDIDKNVIQSDVQSSQGNDSNVKISLGIPKKTPVTNKKSTKITVAKRQKKIVTKASRVKKKQLKTNPKDTDEDDNQRDVQNTQENVQISKSVPKKTPVTNKESTKITLKKTTKKTVNKRKRIECGLRLTNAKIKTIDKPSNLNINSEETRVVVSQADNIINILNVGYNKKSKNIVGNSKKIENHDIVNFKEMLEHGKGALQESDISEDITQSTKTDGNYKRIRSQEGTLKCVANKRKIQPEQTKVISELTNLQSNLEDHEETLKPIANKQRNKSENLKDTRISQSVKTNAKKIEKNAENGKKTLKSVVKKVRKSKNSGNVEWSCSKCEYKTKYKHHLNRHNLVHSENGKMLTCSKCVYSTRIQRNLDRHMLKHSSENYIQCAQCIYSTVNKCHLKKHMLIHKQCDDSEELNVKEGCESDKTTHLKKPLGFRCQECPFVTGREEKIIAHVRTHKSKEKIFTCTECHYITTRTHSLKDHMELHNNDSSNKNFKCKLCSFRGKRHTHLVSHMVTHQKEFNFNCSVCEYKAKRKSHLVTHMLRHQSSDKKIMFQCPYCKYQSIRKEHLKLHCRNVHYNKEEVDCNEAQITVGNDKNSSSNTKKKTLKCPYCSYRNQASSMDVHIFTAHFPSESDQMECNDCSYTTDKRKTFLNHIKLHHNRKSV